MILISTLINFDSQHISVSHSKPNSPPKLKPSCWVPVPVLASVCRYPTIFIRYNPNLLHILAYFNFQAITFLLKTDAKDPFQLTLLRSEKPNKTQNFINRNFKNLNKNKIYVKKPNLRLLKQGVPLQNQFFIHFFYFNNALISK